MIVNRFQHSIISYRPEIDGLRALAVFAVILYHAELSFLGSKWFQGGFIGVDIFFVISGYLITSIVQTELATTNKFNFFRFYSRRLRRILPVLLVVIAFCFPFAWHLMLPIHLEEFATSSLAANAFVSNYFFLNLATSYGAEAGLVKPLLHSWSLGVEAQSYIFISIAIFASFRLGRRFMLLIFTALTVAGIFGAVHEVAKAPDLAFFSVHTRYWELLIGSILAISKINYGKTTNRVAKTTLPLFGFLLILISIFVFDKSTLHPSLLTLIPIIGTSLIILYCSPDDLVTKFLSSKLMLTFGVISYSLYLWHFPIFAFGRISLANNPSNFDKLGWISCTFFISALSYFLIEKPFRNKNIIPTGWYVLITTLIITILCSLSYMIIQNNGFYDRVPPILSQKDLNEPIWNRFEQDGNVCFGRTKNFCSIDNSKELTTVYALGDSHFSSMSETLISKLSDKYNYTEANIGGCPFILGVDVFSSSGRKREDCDSELQSKRHTLLRKAPSIVIIGGRYPVYLNSEYFDNQEGGVEGGTAPILKSSTSLNIKESFKLTVKKLISAGHRVVLVYPIPEVGAHVPATIFDRLRGKPIDEINNTFNIFTTSSSVFYERSKSTFELFNSIQSDQIYRVFPHQLFCDSMINDRCITHDRFNSYYVDDDHPSSAGSSLIVDLIHEKIIEAETDIRSGQSLR